MFCKSVEHWQLNEDWPDLFTIKNPQTLVLGSFNPYNPQVEPLDYYYGRESNGFWRAIAALEGKDEEYYFHSDREEARSRKLATMDDRFALADLIDRIDFKSENEQSLDKYINQKVLKGFADQNIWRAASGSAEELVFLRRHYNQKILKFVAEQKSLKTIIHTLGSSNLSESKLSPQELSLGEDSLWVFFRKLEKLCQEHNIKFIRQSLSPSGYALSNGATDFERLKDFYREHLKF